ncbi:hypothetical protein ACFSHQ_21220 [Gemmobacter lanyuensis]
MSAGEKDALRVAVERCWNVAALSTEAQRTTVSVRVKLGADKKPVATTIELAESNGSPAATRQAFEAARRAILRCGAKGFPLPDEKFDTWKDLKLVFDSRGWACKPGLGSPVAEMRQGPVTELQAGLNRRQTGVAAIRRPLMQERDGPDRRSAPGTGKRVR